jgi:hypothetical protein
MRVRVRTSPLLVMIVTGVMAGCGGVEVAGGPDGGPGGSDGGLPGVPDGGFTDPTARLFDPAHLVEIRIELPAADWEQLRRQTRSLFDVLAGDCVAAPFPSPFTTFTGTVTIDGMVFPNVGVRKKGFIGSLSTTKPSLKLKLDYVTGNQRAFGMDGLTLNNARQDPALVRQCLGYAAFTRAGIPAPRCNFAHVVVNGADLGVYAHVEDVDKDFLRRHFEIPSGNLYEGTLSDFDATWMGTFELKTNELINDRSDLLAVADALTAPDAQLAARLEPLIDLDQVYTYWAMESLVRQWDGYAGNTNNFFLYHEPISGRFQFLPWGIDGIMDPAPFDAVSNRPVLVMTKGLLVRRLYGIPSSRSRYLAQVRTLLDTVFEETAMLAEIDRMQRLISPRVPAADGAAFRAGLDQVRAFVRGRRQAVLAELAAPPAAAAPAPPPCLARIGTISGSFSTTWNTLAAPDPFAAGRGTLTATVEGTPLAVDLVGAVAGLDTSGTEGPQAAVNVIVRLTDGTFAAAILRIDPAIYAPNLTLPFDLISATGALLNFAGPAPEITGLMGKGSVSLVAAGATAGAAVSGSFSADLVAWPF